MTNLPVTPEQISAALADIDWEAIDAMTDEDIACQIAEDPDAPPDLSDAPPELVRVIHPPGGVNVRGIRAKLDLTQDEFAARFGFSVSRTRKKSGKGGRRPLCCGLIAKANTAYCGSWPLTRLFPHTVSLLHDWEQGRTQPDASTQILLLVIEREPELVAKVVAQKSAGWSVQPTR